MRTVSRRSTLALLAATVAALAAPAAAVADEGQIIVKYAAGADARERADARADADVVAAGSLPLDRTQVVAPETGTSVAEAVADLERSPDVAYAEPDRVRTADMDAPNDPLFSMEWGLGKIGAPAAWDASTGAGVTVGVIDSGIDAGHSDLAGQTQPGWNFIGTNANTADLNGHGTHVAGTIAAATNNEVGAAGVAFGARLTPLRVLDANGSGSVSDLIAAYAYAESHHIRIVNASLGGVGFEQSEYDAIRAAKDVLFVVAAGNGGRDGIGDSDDDSSTAEYPCAYTLPNIVCVAATRSNDTLASFSNYGTKSVDIAAPGVNVWSTYPVALDTTDGTPDGYTSLSGTSMATPHVTGAAALVLANEPNLTPWQLGQALVSSADKVPALATQVASGGRLNAAAALGITPPAASEQPEIAPASTPATPADTTPVEQPTAPTTPTTPTTTTPAAPQPAPSTVTPSTPAPAPGTTTTTPVAPAVDRTAPTLALSLSTRGALTALRKGRLRVKTTVSERASVRVEVRLDARTAKKLHLKATKRGVRIATGSASATGSAKVKLKLTSAAKRALARVRRVKATITATARDAAGNRSARSRTLTIKR